jgi:hypothetical protein
MNKKADQRLETPEKSATADQLFEIIYFHLVSRKIHSISPKLVCDILLSNIISLIDKDNRAVSYQLDMTLLFVGNQ